MDPFFAAATYDELWLLRNGTATLAERRIGHGQSSISDAAPLRIEASDRIDDVSLHRELTASAALEAERAIEELRQVASPCQARVRTIADVRRIGAHTRTSTSLSITIPYAGTKVSLVTTPDRSRADLATLVALAGTPPEGEVDYGRYPIFWRRGSAAVLFHEAIGHPAEHGHAALQWPSWLSVRDDPAFAAFHALTVDDTGMPAQAAFLTAGERPRAQRRGSFRDAPLSRMTNLVAACDGAPLDLPAAWIEVHLLAGGAYEPLTGMVTLSISVSDLVTPGGRRRLAPFEFVEGREDIAGRMVGGGGPTVLYPGVICSSEGQELVVGSAAPDILTSEFAA
jgi:hypothetical protein